MGNSDSILNRVLSRVLYGDQWYNVIELIMGSTPYLTNYFHLQLLVTK